jgi:Putative Ig domain
VSVPLRHALAALAVAGIVVAAATAPGPARAAQPRVLLIGDSVSTAMLWHSPAVAALQKNLAVDWQVAVCRTLTGESCPFEGARPETALDLIDAMPSVPPIVVVEMGYNDPQDTFADAVDETVSALVAKGAKQVLWLTLAATRPPYPQLDTLLTSAAARDPHLELVDWDADSFGHAAWFQNDFVHLTIAGGVAMAHLVHASIVALSAPLAVRVKTLPALRPGRAYRTQLRVTGGTAPYRWSVGGGSPPRGIHLRANGILYGKPVGTAPMDFVARVVDADGVKAWTTVYARTASS